MHFFKTKAGVLCLDLFFGLLQMLIIALMILYPMIIVIFVKCDYCDQYMLHIILLNILLIAILPSYFSILLKILYVPRCWIFWAFTIYFPFKGYADHINSVYCDVSSSWNNIEDFITDRSKLYNKQPGKLRRRIQNGPLKSIQQNNIQIKTKSNSLALELKHLYVIWQHQFHVSSSYKSLISNLIKRSLLFIVQTGFLVEYYNKEEKLICFQLFIRIGYTYSFFYHYSTNEAKKLHLVMNAVRIAVINTIRLNKQQKTNKNPIKYLNLTLNEKSACTLAKKRCCFDELDHRINFAKSWDLYFGGYTAVYSGNVTKPDAHISSN